MSMTERGLAVEVLGHLQRSLPQGWQANLPVRESASEVSQRGWRPDGILEITPPTGRSIKLAIEVKVTVTPREAWAQATLSGRAPGTKATQLGLYHADNVDGFLLVTSFLSERARELLAETRVSYADATGNMRIVVDDPPIFIAMDGVDKLSIREDPYRDGRQRLLRSLKGPGAALGVRALVDFRPPYGLRDLADRADVSVGTLSRVLRFAAAENLVEREPRGPIIKVDWEGFLRRWAKDYSFLRSNRSRLVLEPRGIDALLVKLGQYRRPYALSGSLAAHTVSMEAPAALAVVYVTEPDAAKELGLRETEAGGNVMLVEPFPSTRRPETTSPFVRTRDVAGLIYVALPQAVADLLTGPGRGPAEAEGLMAWMKGNEDAWRIT